ncbi:hypothetical protein D3C71_1695550 [compost metagenome]
MWSRIIGKRGNESTLFPRKMCVRRKNSQDVPISGKNRGLLSESLCSVMLQTGIGVEDSPAGDRMFPLKVCSDQAPATA